MVFPHSINLSKERSFPGDLDCKESACHIGDAGSIPGWEDPLEEEVETHSSILVWEILWTEEPGELQSMGSQRFNTTE